VVVPPHLRQRDKLCTRRSDAVIVPEGPSGSFASVEGEGLFAETQLRYLGEDPFQMSSSSAFSGRRRTNNETRSCLDDNLSDLQERPSLPVPPAG
jgi:hypothetical protein